MTLEPFNHLLGPSFLEFWKDYPKTGEPMVEQPTNYIKFERELCKQYERLFADDPKYAFSASKCTPASLAAKMTGGLRDGSANKDGEGIKMTCKLLEVKYTYKAIQAYLKS